MSPNTEVQPTGSSPFPAEVDTFTQSYQYASILPTFSRTPRRPSPSTHNNLSQTTAANKGDKLHSNQSISKEDVQYDSQAAPSGASSPLYGLGATATPQIFIPSTPSTSLQNHHSHKSLDRSSTFTPENRRIESKSESESESGSESESEDEDESEVTRFRRSAAPSPDPTPQYNDPEPNEKAQEKDAPAAESHSGFTPTIEQGEGPQDPDDRPVKKLCLMIKSSPQAYPVSAQSASGIFGPALQSSINQQAKPAEQLLIVFSKEHYKSLTRGMTPDVRRKVRFVHISKVGLPRPIIKLKVYPPPLTEFHLFTRLPTEIQCRIWHFCLPGPRVVRLLSTWERTGLEIYKPFKTPVAAVLQACAQSRFIATRTLKQAFENTYVLQGAYTYFDYSTDILRPYNGNHVETIRSITYAKTPSIVQCRQQVQHLEIPFHIVESSRQYRILANLIMQIPRTRWPALKTLTFPGCPGECGDCGKEERYRMALLEIGRAHITYEELLNCITDEFNCLWTEVRNDFPDLQHMPNFGLKVAYLDHDSE
jgi:hypothetical protein